MMTQSTLLAFALEIGVDVLVKGSLVLVVALGATGLLRRRSAATRDLVWRLAFAVLLLLPLMAALLPEWRVATLQVHIASSPALGEIVPLETIGRVESPAAVRSENWEPVRHARIGERRVEQEYGNQDRRAWSVLRAKPWSITLVRWSTE